MSKATVTLLKRYVAILNITNTKQYICCEYIQTLLKEDYGIDVYLRGVQRDLKFLHDVGAVECKGNMPKGWRSNGVEGFGEKMLSFREDLK
jgi:hypothetical protein